MNISGMSKINNYFMFFIPAYLPFKTAIKSNVIKNVAKNLECIKCMLSGSFATLWMTTHRISCI